MENIQPIKKLFYSIGEVSELLSVKEHVLRYWETEFKEIHPVKGQNGHRRYRDKDIDKIKLIKHLLWEDKLKIEGAKKRLSDIKKTDEFKWKLEEIENSAPAGLDKIKEELYNVLNILNK